MEAIFYGPPVADQVKEPLCRTALTAETGPARDDLHAAFLWGLALPLHTKPLPDFSPLPAQLRDCDQEWGAYDAAPDGQGLSPLARRSARSASGSAKNRSTSARVTGVVSLLITITSPPARCTNRPNSWQLCAASVVRIRPVHRTSVNTGLSVLTSLRFSALGQWCKTLPVCPS